MASRKKPILLSVLGIVIVVLILGGIKAAQISAMIEAGEAYVPPALGVTTADVRTVKWRSEITAVGTLVAVQGVVRVA